MNEQQKPVADCRGWRRTERRTRAAKEIELEIRRREQQRARSLRGGEFVRHIVSRRRQSLVSGRSGDGNGRRAGRPAGPNGRNDSGAGTRSAEKGTEQQLREQLGVLKEQSRRLQDEAKEREREQPGAAGRRTACNAGDARPGPRPGHGAVRSARSATSVGTSAATSAGARAAAAGAAATGPRPAARRCRPMPPMPPGGPLPPLSGAGGTFTPFDVFGSLGAMFGPGPAGRAGAGGTADAAGPGAATCASRS